METRFIHYPSNIETQNGSPAAMGIKTAYESRNTLSTGDSFQLKDDLRLNLFGRVEGFLSDRMIEEEEVLKARLDEASIEFTIPGLTGKVGISKVFWGKLDQISPVDAVNPLDLSTLFLTNEKREAKKALPMAVLSPKLNGDTRFDLVLLPKFEGTTFDRSSSPEGASPFNTTRYPVPLVNDKPEENSNTLEYGGRLATTTAGVDWSLCYLRTFQDTPSFRLDFMRGVVVADYLENHMYGADFETVSGEWGFRGEAAYFAGRTFENIDAASYVKGDSFSAGIGVDNTKGPSYQNYSVLYSRIFAEGPLLERKEELTVMSTLERKFASDTRVAKVFMVYNALGNSIFLRGAYRMNLEENLWATIAAGFFGRGSGGVGGTDSLSLFKDADYFSMDCKYSF